MDDERVLAEALNERLDTLEAGGGGAKVGGAQDDLARYPQQAARLEDLLQLSMQVKAVPVPAPTPQMLAAGEQRLVQAMQARAAARRAEGSRSRGIHTALPDGAENPRQAERSRVGWYSTRVHTALPPNHVDPIVSKRAERPSVRSGARPRPNLWLPLGALAGVVAVLAIALTVIVASAGTYQAWRTSRATPVSSPVATAPGVSAPSAEAQANAGATLAPTLTLGPAPAQGAVRPTAGAGATAAPDVGAAGGAVAATTPEHSAYLPLAARPIPPTQAMLQDLRGLVQVQAANGAWSPASEQQLLQAGRRIRTGALSAVDLAFYDGSTAHLGPETELSLDQLGQDPQDLSRVVVLTQALGETDHYVAPALGANGKYAVNTPSGSGTAKGTVFHVSVTPAQVSSSLAPGTRVTVDQGAVAVTHVDVTVLVVAGQQTTVRAGAPPSQPVFRVSGEGLVEAVGPTWQIAGQAFLSDEHTALVGDPQVGDWVHVEGHLLPNGDRMADRIVLVHRAEAQRFTLSGVVQARGDASWTVAGQTIAISDSTAIDDLPGAEGMIAVGDSVRVRGIILDDGALLAQSIVRIEPQGWPFSFVGIVESISDTAWVVSGIPVTVDPRTSVEPGLAVGDTVRVRGVRVPPASAEEQDSWLARSIVRFQPPEQSFEFVGLVESMDPWVVSGIDLATDPWTEIEQGIATGDRVKVEGRILPDGAWLAEEIGRLDDREGLPFEFSGEVESIDPWVVSGVSLTVDGRTEIRGLIAVGDSVKVEGQILPSGAWLATEIKRIDGPLGLGCLQITSLVTGVDGGQVVLHNGVTLRIEGVPTQGQVLARSVIQVYLCVDGQGNVTLISIIVLYQVEPEVVVAPTRLPRPKPAPTTVPDHDDDDDDGCDCDDDDDRDDDDDDDDGDDDGDDCDCAKRQVVICHKDSKHPKTMTVPWEAWISGHKGHGDTLGPCD